MRLMLNDQLKSRAPSLSTLPRIVTMRLSPKQDKKSPPLLLLLLILPCFSPH